MATGLISQQNSSDSSVQLAFNDLPPSEIGQQRMHSTGCWPSIAGTENVQKLLVESATEGWDATRRCSNGTFAQ